MVRRSTVTVKGKALNEVTGHRAAIADLKKIALAAEAKINLHIEKLWTLIERMDSAVENYEQELAKYEKLSSSERDLMADSMQERIRECEAVMAELTALEIQIPKD